MAAIAANDEGDIKTLSSKMNRAGKALVIVGVPGEEGVRVYSDLLANRVYLGQR